MCQIVKTVEAIFGIGDDRDFGRADPAHPYLVIAPTSECERVVYTTKPQLLSAVFAHEESVRRANALIGRFGLPRDCDFALVERVIQGRPFVFVGDLDVPDLLVFAWLREKAKPATLTYWGISDRFLECAGGFPDQHLHIPFSNRERQIFRNLRHVIPDLEHVIGPKCTAILARCEKLEIDAVVNPHSRDERVIAEAFKGTLGR